jgi:hypothetical protein
LPNWSGTACQRTGPRFPGKVKEAFLARKAGLRGRSFELHVKDKAEYIPGLYTARLRQEERLSGWSGQGDNPLWAASDLRVPAPAGD